MNQLVFETFEVAKDRLQLQLLEVLPRLEEYGIQIL
jgi:hypothetical protein